jgi:protein-tyrosine phosphatase
VIDLHCHVLAGIDDGPATLEESVALARAAASAGTRTLIATPHVSWEYPNDAGTIAGLVTELGRRLTAEGVALEIRPGAEIAMTRVIDTPAEELARLTLGGGRWLLVEPPFAAAVIGLDTIIAELQGSGYHVLMAHPERCPAFHRDRSMLEALVASGALSSVTAGSLAGRFGRRVRRFALELIRDGLAHNVSSDAHDHIHRPPTIASELAEAGLGGLSAWLTHEVPAAILRGGAIPPRPIVEAAPRRLPWQRR